MPASIACPQCHRLLQVSEAEHGREVRCPECQHVFVAGLGTGITATPPRPEATGSTSLQSGLPAAAAFSPGERAHRVDDDDDELQDRLVMRRTFKSGGGLALSVKILLGVSLLLELAALGSNFMQYNLVTRMVAGENVPFMELDSNDTRQMIFGIVHFITYVATAIVFVIWFYRVHANLEPLGAHALTYTSGWAAGAWFVPIMNLYRPVQIAQEIWRNSDPEAVNADGDWHEGPSSGLLGCWWAMWIISNVIGHIAMRMSWDARTPDTLLAATTANMIADIASAIACLLAISVVFAIDSRQTARAAAMNAPHDLERKA